MSSIRKDKNGIYFIDLRVNGKRIRRSLDTKDKTLARMKSRIMERDLAGIIVKPSTTFEEFKKEYFTWAESIKSPRTIEVERSCMKIFASITKMYKLSELNPHTIDSFIAKITKTNSAATANYYIRTLRSIFNTAVRWQSIHTNPFATTKLLRFELSPPRILSRDEIHKIFKYVRTNAQPYLQLYTFYLLTGLRRNEALHLKWQDIDFARNVIIIKHTKGKRFRYVPMLQKVVKLLKSRRGLPQPFTFPIDKVSKTYKNCAVLAGITDTKLHDLRKSFASYLSEAGIAPILVQKWLGHESYRITDEHYIGTTEEQWKSILNLDLQLFKN